MLVTPLPRKPLLLETEEIHDTNTYCPLWPQNSRCVFKLAMKAFLLDAKRLPPRRRRLRAGILEGYWRLLTASGNPLNNNQ